MGAAAHAGSARPSNHRSLIEMSLVKDAKRKAKVKDALVTAFCALPKRNFDNLYDAVVTRRLGVLCGVDYEKYVGAGKA